jgi:hypothetical protein
MDAIYGTAKSDRKVVSFVRDNRKNSCSIKSEQYRKLSKDAKKRPIPMGFRTVKDLDDHGHALRLKCLYDVFNQISLDREETIFDIGIGCLQLAIHGSFITGNNVHGNENDFNLLYKIEGAFSKK